jgi:hypothetical protein
MPRIKAKSDRLLYSIRRVSLTKATQDNLVEIVGLDPTIPAERKSADQGLAKVERILGYYPALRDSLDQGPRAAHHLQTLSRLRPIFNELERLLPELHGDLKAVYYYAGMDTETLCQQLDQFLSLTHCIQGFLEGRESRHAPYKAARQIVATSLACIFLSFRPPLPDVQGRAVSPDMDLKQFVAVALKAIGVRPPSSQHWPRILKAAAAYHVMMR